MLSKKKKGNFLFFCQFIHLFRFIKFIRNARLIKLLDLQKQLLT